MRKELLWLIAGFLFAAYAIFGWYDPAQRLRAHFHPQTVPAGAIHADMTPELAQLSRMDYAAAEFARSGKADIYEVNTLADPDNSTHLPGTTIVIVNRARLSTVELRALALSHELFHAAHRVTLSDLLITEEFQAHRHVSRIAAAYHIPLPANDTVDVGFFLMPSLLLLLSAGAAIAAHLSPRSTR